LHDSNREPIVFDVNLQGKPALSEVTLPITGTGSDSANLPEHATAIVHEVEHVRVTDNLVIDLVAKQGRPRLNAIEVVRQTTLKK
jgi:hypothetical protein